MSFLTLNGVTVPVADGSVKGSLVELGTRERAFSGALRTDIRASKHRWSMRTPPLDASTAQAMSSLIRGNSDYLGFDGAAYSDHGIGAASGSVLNYQPGTAADGTVVYRGAKIGSNSLWSWGGVSNLLATNQRSAESGTTGFTAVDGATLSSSATRYMVGTKSLKTITSATANAVAGGFYTMGIAVSAYAAYGSVYLTGSGSVSVYLRDETNGVTGGSATVVLDGTWQRANVGIVVGGSGSTSDLRLYVVETTPDSGLTFYADAMQIAVDTYGAPFADPTLAASKITYPIDIARMGSAGFALGLWLKQDEPISPFASNQVLVHAGLGDEFAIFFDAANQLLVMRMLNGSSVDDVELSTTLAGGGPYNFGDGQWHHFVFVLDQSPPSGRYKKEIWVDGVLEAGGSPSAVNDPSTTATSIVFGSNQSFASHFKGSVDGIEFRGAPLSSAMIGVIAAATTHLVAYPSLYASGDVVAGALGRTVRGQIDDVEIVAARLGGSFVHNAQVLSLTLEEV